MTLLAVGKNLNSNREDKIFRLFLVKFIPFVRKARKHS